jgi:hypothetical protein
MMVDSLSAHKGSRKAEVEEYGYALMYRSMRPSQRKIRPPTGKIDSQRKPEEERSE